MSRLLSTYAVGRDNNFNLVRFIAAFLVLYSHSFAIVTGSGAAEPLRSTLGMTWGGVAVDIFFITSGFLVTGSYLSRNNFLSFAWARILRIYPALIVAVLFCVLVVGLSFTTVSIWKYLTDWQTVMFFLKNITLFFGIEYDLPGVFYNLPMKIAVNGSLWTLPYEVKMYVILAVFLYVFIYVRGRFGNDYIKPCLLFVAIAAVFANIINHLYPFVSVIFLHLFSMFVAGSACYIYKNRIYLSSKLFLTIIILLLAASFYPKLFLLIYVLSLPYLVLYISYVPSGVVREFNKVGDYSYGIYIYAFPVQQSMAALIPDISIATMILTSFTLTLFLSVLSWHLIEKRFLEMKNSSFIFEYYKKKMPFSFR